MSVLRQPLAVNSQDHIVYPGCHVQVDMLQLSLLGGDTQTEAP